MRRKIQITCKIYICFYFLKMILLQYYCMREINLIFLIFINFSRLSRKKSGQSWRVFPSTTFVCFLIRNENTRNVILMELGIKKVWKRSNVFIGMIRLIIVPLIVSCPLSILKHFCEVDVSIVQDRKFIIEIWEMMLQPEGSEKKLLWKMFECHLQHFKAFHTYPFLFLYSNKSLPHLFVFHFIWDTIKLKMKIDLCQMNCNQNISREKTTKMIFLFFYIILIFTTLLSTIIFCFILILIEFHACWKLCRTMKIGKFWMNFGNWKKKGMEIDKTLKKSKNS